ncbi:hypothetical protein KY285_020524 [Solanum tuberosum]|nr:hypothetical protein KY285_020524 [Solanum tuberosum]
MVFQSLETNMSKWRQMLRLKHLRKRSRRHLYYVPVTEIVYGAMATADVRKANVKEFEMALQDRVMEEKKDRKNVDESYACDMRDKLSDIYQEFATDSEREKFIAKLQEMEDWLYEDREDETRGVYIAKLEVLKKHGDPI